MKTSGYFVAVATLGGVGCGSDDASVPEGPYRFPQGIASGDPRETSVLLWTRVEATDGSTGPITVTAQVADSADFANLVLDQEVTVTQDSDHTLRLVVTGLASGTTYYYRFIADTVTSVTGRTLTAPPRDDTAPVRLAWVSCQDYGAGMYGAYRELIKDDDARPAGDKIQFVVHLGDFIYETVGDQFQVPLDDDFLPVELVDRRGNPRVVEPLPAGGTYAQSLDDYRHLYKQYMRDPDLQAARARWPFICIWDDHEFTDDAWQTQANYEGAGSLDEPSQKRKVAANQAWFEYTPANLSGAEGVPEVPPAAADFVPVVVDDVAYEEVDENNQIIEANNVAALASMTVYRSFRYGKNVELVITDERSYRSDHPIPEELTSGYLFFHPRSAVPKEMAETFDAGKDAGGGAPPDTVLDVANPRTQSPPGTMLGPVQKQWWKDTMSQSDAVWKIWGNEVPLMHFLVKNEPAVVLIVDRVMTSDAWDGYASERRELMQYLRDQSIGNVIVITGDIHAHFAGLVVDDYGAAEPQPVAAEFCAAGISSNSLFSFFEYATRELPPGLRNLVTYDATAKGGTDKFVNNLNVMLLHGSSAAKAAAETNSIPDILAAKDPEVNPYLSFADTNAQGYGTLTITSESVTATLVTVNRGITDSGEEGPGIKATATYVVPKDNVAATTGPELTGVKPFPFA